MTKGRDCLSPIDRINGINKARSEVGLPPVVERVRECLRCNRKFKAIGNVNRMCSGCRRRGVGSLIEEAE